MSIDQATKRFGIGEDRVSFPAPSVSSRFDMSSKKKLPSWFEFELNSYWHVVSLLTKHSYWIVVTTESREFSNSAWSYLTFQHELSFTTYPASTESCWCECERMTDHISRFISRPQTWLPSKPRFHVPELLTDGGSMDPVCETKTTQIPQEKKLHSTGELTRTCLRESITSGTHFSRKYFLALNVQSFATSILARTPVRRLCGTLCFR